jgi:hypothetical protein
MTVVHAFPSQGSLFFDARDDGRSFRVNSHPDRGIVVFSTWRHGSCVASCHLDRADIPALVNELVVGLAAPAEGAWTEPTYVEFSPPLATPASKPRRPVRWRGRRKDRG